MVFVWSNLTRGDAPFTLSQVALNDAVMVIAFAPIVALLLGVSAIIVPWETLLISVALYIVVPVIVAQALRGWLGGGDGARLAAFGQAVQPLSIAALLAAVVLLFAFQGRQILDQPIIIALLAVPIFVQTIFIFIFGFAYVLNRVTGEAHCIAGPSALIGASNFFELAVAVAISLFGINSGAALATVVGVLIEVPVMLALVAIVNRSKGWYEAGSAVRKRTMTARATSRPEVAS
jgi:ACR3 family arsenite transporter